MSAETTTPVIEETTSKPRYCPRYNVVILNDDDHTYHYVTAVIMKVFKYELEKAFKLTKQVDKEGRAIVWTGSLEVAELKRDQIKGCGPDLYAEKKVDWPLGVDLEPVD